MVTCAPAAAPPSPAWSLVEPGGTCSAAGSRGRGGQGAAGGGGCRRRFSGLLRGLRVLLVWRRRGFPSFQPQPCRSILFHPFNTVSGLELSRLGF